ncbi:hypothetical protein [Alicyclobacillus fodiniaquatilis]|jgi:hypothetical protein|uniref:Uncharacterized protein n=1 Tax=Alicyclobacillus fodiniaquatilis TaxID=1661150 RepID=A0ABW4JFJ4_9BACL
MSLPAVNFHHTLSDIINASAKAGFCIQQMVEEQVDDHSTSLSQLPREVAIVAKK